MPVSSTGFAPVSELKVIIVEIMDLKRGFGGLNEEVGVNHS
jgi:hypothetical protein